MVLPGSMPDAHWPLDLGRVTHVARASFLVSQMVVGTTTFLTRISFVNSLEVERPVGDEREADNRPLRPL